MISRHLLSLPVTVQLEGPLDVQEAHRLVDSPTEVAVTPGKKEEERMPSFIQQVTWAFAVCHFILFSLGVVNVSALTARDVAPVSRCMSSAAQFISPLQKKF
jgi:hypothetical protein